MKELLPYADQIERLDRFGFIHNRDNTQIVAANRLGNWIDRHKVRAIASQADNYIYNLRQELQSMVDQTTPLVPIVGDPKLSRQLALEEVRIQRNLLYTVLDSVLGGVSIETAREARFLIKDVVTSMVSESE